MIYFAKVRHKVLTLIHRDSIPDQCKWVGFERAVNHVPTVRYRLESIFGPRREFILYQATQARQDWNASARACFSATHFAHILRTIACNLARGILRARYHNKLSGRRAQNPGPPIEPLQARKTSILLPNTVCSPDATKEGRDGRKHIAYINEMSRFIHSMQWKKHQQVLFERGE